MKARHVGLLLVASLVIETAALAQQCEYPIADLSACPKRTPRPSHTPTVNGCGPEWFPKGLKAPQGSGPVNFAPACNRHDECYEKCNAVKEQCDNVFGKENNDACWRQYPAPARPQNDQDWDSRGKCTSLARLYARAVKEKAQSAYDDAQKKACECCRSFCPAEVVECEGRCCLPAQTCNNNYCCSPCTGGWVTCAVMPDANIENRCGFRCCNPATPNCSEIQQGKCLP